MMLEGIEGRQMKIRETSKESIIAMQVAATKPRLGWN